nr:hypothetical protein [Gemmatimonadota bacterium]NIR77411.1 hypothetical protein [Gemmatimonadota bacterium]NIT88675.1 hypothetical protein [Gemmatimonadota bacterium]NIU32490.1 hypothetical protein [Gemmatimonadota bacterium]NIU34785.1 hypothetical protein [Gemmatimonadota bacterium]
MHSTSPQHAASPAARGRIRTASRAVALAVAVLVAAACDGADAPTEPSEEIRAPTPRSAVIPSDGELATVTHGPTTLTFWPWTGRGPDTDAITDPINLIFAGDAGPRAIRAALTALDGNRPAPFPPAFPFDCAWKDAMARPQASYGEEEGWTGSAVQLECGEYDPIRFHLRLFDVGEWTVANAHLDLLIPGTSEHQVIAWEAAEKLVAFDIMRTGLLDEGPAVTEPINAAPSWRAIPAPIYDGIPAALKAFIGGPPASGGNPVEIGTDGRATLLTLAGSAPPPAARVSRGLTVPFDQIVPRPVCSTAPGDFVHLEGSVELTLSVGVSRSGHYR